MRTGRRNARHWTGNEEPGRREARTELRDLKLRLRIRVVHTRRGFNGEWMEDAQELVLEDQMVSLNGWSGFRSCAKKPPGAGTAKVSKESSVVRKRISVLLNLEIKSPPILVTHKLIKFKMNL